MRRSINEFCAVTGKAGVAAGFPPDLAADTARAAALLSAHGYDGAAIALHALKNGMGAPPQREAGRIVYAVTHAASAGMAAAEALLAAAAKQGAAQGAEGCRAECNRIDSPLLLVALVAVAAQEYQWRYALTFYGGDDAAAEAQVVHIPAGDDFPVDLARIVTPRADLQVTGQADEKHRIEFPLPAQGVEVGEAEWAQMEQLAMQTYVTASEESRSEGAGAGDIDND